MRFSTPGAPAAWPAAAAARRAGPFTSGSTTCASTLEVPKATAPAAARLRILRIVFPPYLHAWSGHENRFQDRLGEGDSPILLPDHPATVPHGQIGTVPGGFETSSSARNVVQVERA